MAEDSAKRRARRELALDAHIKLVRAVESLSARMHRTITRAGLSHSQFGVLDALYHCGPLSQKELAGKILKSTGNMTTVVNNLEKRGLVCRTQDRRDKRIQSVHLCAQGQQLFEQLFPAHVKRIEHAFGAFSDDELADLGRLSKRLGLRALDDEIWQEELVPEELDMHRAGQLGSPVKLYGPDRSDPSTNE